MQGACSGGAELSGNSELVGASVLVTGGAGFIGSHIVDLLCDEGCFEIVALDNMVRGRPENLKRASARGPVRLVHGASQRSVAIIGFPEHLSISDA